MIAIVLVIPLCRSSRDKIRRFEDTSEEKDEEDENKSEDNDDEEEDEDEDTDDEDEEIITENADDGNVKIEDVTGDESVVKDEKYISNLLKKYWYDETFKNEFNKNLKKNKKGDGYTKIPTTISEKLNKDEVADFKELLKYHNLKAKISTNTTKYTAYKILDDNFDI